MYECTFSLAIWSTLDLRSVNSPKYWDFSFSALWGKTEYKRGKVTLDRCQNAVTDRRVPETWFSSVQSGSVGLVISLVELI